MPVINNLDWSQIYIWNESLVRKRPPQKQETKSSQLFLHAGYSRTQTAVSQNHQICTQQTTE